MNGVFYGVGVGPGDPELMTLKAVRVLKECPVIALPGTAGETAYGIALRALPELAAKQKLPLAFLMQKDREKLCESHDAAAERVAAVLSQGKDVAFLTLGDPSVYSTYLYLKGRLARRGFATEMVAGVPSFCAAAAALGEGLCAWDEPLHLIPASFDGVEDALALPGTKVLMKAGKTVEKTLALLREKGLLDKTSAAVNCGMEGEKLYSDARKMQGSDSYFTLFLVHDGREEEL